MKRFFSSYFTILCVFTFFVNTIPAKASETSFFKEDLKAKTKYEFELVDASYTPENAALLWNKTNNSAIPKKFEETITKSFSHKLTSSHTINSQLISQLGIDIGGVNTSIGTGISTESTETTVYEKKMEVTCKINHTLPAF